MKEVIYPKDRTKNSLHGPSFNIINVDDTNILTDINKIKLIRELCKTVAILKIDEDNGIVLTTNNDYVNPVQELFEDPNKFKFLNENPTITRTSTLQSYLRKLNTSEITKSEFDAIRRKNKKSSKSTWITQNP